MQRLVTFITPDGEWLLPGTPEFLAALGDPDPDYDAEAFAVKNLGFIKFVTIERSIIEIEFHPRNTSLTALLAAQQQVVSSSVTLFRIKYFETAWASEISSSAEQTVSRLSELCAPACNPLPSERFHVEQQDISLLFQDEYNPLRSLAQKWRMSFGIFDPTVISVAVTNRLLPRLVVAAIKPHRPDPTWRFIGDGHRWLGNYQVHGIGEKVANMPDKDYGAWVTEFYKSVAASGQPRYDHVTGSLRYEDEAAKPVKPVHYERLMLPWRTPSDEVFVTACTRKFGSDDIPMVGLGAGAAYEPMKSAMSS